MVKSTKDSTKFVKALVDVVLAKNMNPSHDNPISIEYLNDADFILMSPGSIIFEVRFFILKSNIDLTYVERNKNFDFFFFLLNKCHKDKSIFTSTIFEVV